MKALSATSLVFVVAIGVAVSTRAQEQAAGAKPAAQAAPAGNADTGKKLWSSYGCWQCHGYEGQGGAAGPRLAGRSLTFGYINGYVRKPTNQMPPYTEKVLPNTDLCIRAIAPGAAGSGQHSAVAEVATLTRHKAQGTTYVCALCLI
jgi:mono/diheme cytochrome c family protein